MSVEQFWYEDKRLYDAYQKAYYTNLHEKSWINGIYFDVALNNLAFNISRKKGERPLEYPEKPFNPFEKKPEPITKETLEERFRMSMMNKPDWMKVK